MYPASSRTFFKSGSISALLRLVRCAGPAEHPASKQTKGGFDGLQADGLPARRDLAPRRRAAPASGETGQGTVEYVGLILLVSLLMVGMVAAMKGFNGKQGTELADVIVNKIKEAVDKVAFK